MDPGDGMELTCAPENRLASESISRCVSEWISQVRKWVYFPGAQVSVVPQVMVPPSDVSYIVYKPHEY